MVFYLYILDMIYKFTEYIKESKDYKYRGYTIVFNKDVPPGADGRWEVPDLHYFKHAHKLTKGFKTVSKIQCEEAINRLFDLNQKYVTEAISEYGGEDATIEDVFEDCQPFFEQLRHCERGGLFFRGVHDNIIDVQYNTYDMNREPRDMPDFAHKFFNDAFEKKFGWKVRNGLFCFGYPADIIKREIEGHNTAVSTHYGLKTYIFIPKDDFKICSSDHVSDLFGYLENDLNEYDLRTFAEGQFDEKYGEGAEGTYKYNDIDTGEYDQDRAIKRIHDDPKVFNLTLNEEGYLCYEETNDKVSDNDLYHDMKWFPAVDFEDFVEDCRYDWEEHRNDEWRSLIHTYDDDICRAIKYSNETSFNCNSYYLLDQSYIPQIVEKIWGKE